MSLRYISTGVATPTQRAVACLASRARGSYSTIGTLRGRPDGGTRIYDQRPRGLERVMLCHDVKFRKPGFRDQVRQSQQRGRAHMFRYLPDLGHTLRGGRGGVRKRILMGMIAPSWLLYSPKQERHDSTYCSDTPCDFEAATSLFSNQKTKHKSKEPSSSPLSPTRAGGALLTIHPPKNPPKLGHVPSNGTPS